jgi:hypothetical protein
VTTAKNGEFVYQNEFIHLVKPIFILNGRKHNPKWLKGNRYLFSHIIENEPSKSNISPLIKARFNQCDHCLIFIPISELHFFKVSKG